MSKVIRSLLFIRMLFSSASTTKSNLSSKFLFYIFVTIVFFVGWAIFSDFDQVISSEAKIIPFSKLQTVQHFEGGIINGIHVRAGQKVDVGSKLLSLSPIEADSGYQSKKHGLSGKALYGPSQEFKGLRPNTTMHVHYLAQN